MDTNYNVNQTFLDYGMDLDVGNVLNNTILDYGMDIDADPSLNFTDLLTNIENNTLNILTNISHYNQSLLDVPFLYKNILTGENPSYMTRSFMNFTDIPLEADPTICSYDEGHLYGGNFTKMCNESVSYFSNISSPSESNFSFVYGILFMEDPNELKYPWKSNQEFFPILALYLVTLIFGTTGNIAVIILMAGERKTRTTTNIFLVSLSVADLLMLLICVPLQIITYFVVLWDSGGTICTMTNYFMLLSFTASVLNLTALSLERFIVIVFPMRSRALCTMSNCRRSVILVWAVSMVLACPIIWVMDIDSVTYVNADNSVRLTAHYCKDMDSLTFLMYQLLVLFIIPAVLMFIFYTVVIRELWKSTKVIKALTNSTKRQNFKNSHGEKNYMHSNSMEVTTISSNRSMSIRSTRMAEERPPTRMSIRSARVAEERPSTYNPPPSCYMPYNGRDCSSRSRASIRLTLKKYPERGEDVKKARKQVIKMLIVVLALFLLCWGPYIVVEILINMGMQIFAQWFYVMKTLLALLPYVHCCINPIIYVFMCKKFRRSMKRFLNRMCGGKCRCCCPTPEPPPHPLLSRIATRSLYSSCTPDTLSKETQLEIIPIETVSMM